MCPCCLYVVSQAKLFLVEVLLFCLSFVFCVDMTMCLCVLVVFMLCSQAKLCFAGGWFVFCMLFGGQGCAIILCRYDFVFMCLGCFHVVFANEIVFVLGFGCVNIVCLFGLVDFSCCLEVNVVRDVCVVCFCASFQDE